MRTELEHVTVETDGPVARVVLTRPDRLNAMHYPAVRDLNAVAELLAGDLDVRLVTVEGIGRAFCTGIDLKELSTDEIPMDYYRLWEEALRAFETMDAIVICLVHGYALGGGLQLAMASDIRVCTPDATLGLPAIDESLIPGLGTWRLARYVGLGRAKKLTLLGTRIDGEEAERIGLVDHLVEEDGRQEAFDDLVERYMRANSTGCRLSKAALTACFDLGYEAFLDRYLDLQAEATSSDDFAEAMAAYREDRTPEWS